jgi:hypothetical protein
VNGKTGLVNFLNLCYHSLLSIVNIENFEFIDFLLTTFYSLSVEPNLIAKIPANTIHNAVKLVNHKS